jgi:hypothetical protein
VLIAGGLRPSVVTLLSSLSNSSIRFFSSLRLLSPIFDVGQPLPSFACSGEPALAGLSERREYPAPGFAVALMLAAHLLHECGEFFRGDVSVSGAVVPCAFDQVFGKYPAGVLRVGVRKLANAEQIDVPLLEAGHPEHFLIKQRLGLGNVLTRVPAIEVVLEQIVQHRRRTAVVDLLKQRREVAFVLLPPFVDPVDGVAAFIVAGRYDPFVITAHIHRKPIDPLKGVDPLRLDQHPFFGCEGFELSVCLFVSRPYSFIEEQIQFVLKVGVVLAG